MLFLLKFYSYLGLSAILLYVWLKFLWFLRLSFQTDMSIYIHFSSDISELIWPKSASSSLHPSCSSVLPWVRWCQHAFNCILKAGIFLGFLHLSHLPSSKLPNCFMNFPVILAPKYISHLHLFSARVPLLSPTIYCPHMNRVVFILN